MQPAPENGPFEREPVRRPPAFNVPGIVLALLGAFLVVHVLRVEILGPLDQGYVLLNYAFIPGCYDVVDALCEVRDGGALLWSPLSHAFLHGDWTHLIANSVWLVAFGTPVARRIGSARFLLFSALGAAAGALGFFLLNPELVEPVVGASGVVSALMGGACRFAFTGGLARSADAARFAPMLPVTTALRERTVLFFILAFFVTNLIVGSGLGGAFGAEGAVAWEAHLGGFLFGFLAISLFDTRASRHVA